MFLLITSLLVSLLFHSGTAQKCPGLEPQYLPDDQCEAYNECKDGVAERHECPDGLLFNDKLTEYPRYPCAYPQEVECGSRTRTQVAEGTGDCPRQYGLFKTEDCSGTFRNCIAGKATMFDCPAGLAFNPDAARCDWPDQVMNCDPAVFLGFNCPGGTKTTEDENTDTVHPRYMDPNGDCRKFFVCVDNKNPRAHSCGLGMVFNEKTGSCDDPENVPMCANYYPKDVLEAIKKLRSFDSSF